MSKHDILSECGQQDVAVLSSVHSSSQSCVSPEPQITIPQPLPSQPCKNHSNDSSSTEDTHCHTCDCGTVFACEVEHRGPGDEQQCEYCEVWSMSYGRSTNKQRLADCIDDQAVIEEVKLLAVQDIRRWHSKCAADFNGKGGH